MIVKTDHDNGLELVEALNRRLSASHPKKEIVHSELKKKRSGIKGEREVAYPLSFLDPKSCFILHHLRLADQNGFFQIDTLLLQENYFLILEVKNWQGTVICSENGQVIRINKDKEEGFPNPIAQAKTQQFRLRRWLKDQGFPCPPIEYLVVISFSSTILKPSAEKTTIPPTIIYNDELFFKIQKLNQNYPDRKIENFQLKELAFKLKSAHVSISYNVLHHYHIHYDDLIKGVFCSNCGYAPMIRAKFKWFCTNCQQYSQDAHLQALEDYKLLIRKHITNREAREFLQVESADVVRRLLQANFYYRGSKKSRVYDLDKRRKR